MNDKQRAEFERWAERYHGSLNMGKVGLIYSNQNVQHDFNVWQAAIASVVVELPETFVDRGDHYAYLEHLVKQAIEDAGVKYNEQ